MGRGWIRATDRRIMSTATGDTALAMSEENVEHLLAVGILRVVGKGGGIEIGMPMAVVASLRDGLITRFKDYGDKDQALEAVRLSE